MGVNGYLEPEMCGCAVGELSMLTCSNPLMKEKSSLAAASNSDFLMSV